MSDVQSPNSPVTTPASAVSDSTTSENLEQNLTAGIIAALIAAVVGAALWALITVAIKYQIGWMAVGVGALVGLVVRKVGKGSSMSFGVVGGLFALLGCLGGNLLSTVGFIAQTDSISFFQALSNLPLTAIPDLFAQTFSALDLLFYAIAIYEGYKLALRPAE